MPTDAHLVAAVLVAAAVTLALRALPFTVITRLRSAPIVPWLAARMPVGIMVILAIYTFHDVDIHETGQIAPFLVALIITVGLQLWRHNAILSIVAGTLVCIGVSIALG
ncbi:MAG TPA: AzlD domain-containing protein [Lacisediminihabitans sp.]|uniref:branched-chain amino acid transporter permease n=1 Tax=Lacisediminihabitans sp. TaxID=2787631 RepID=UPI002ED83D9F